MEGKGSMLSRERGTTAGGMQPENMLYVSLRHEEQARGKMQN
jgi:hypothetical protein